VTSAWTIVTALDAIARFTQRGRDPNVEDADGDADLATDRLASAVSSRCISVAAG
jgi:hypothetical protein